MKENLSYRAPIPHHIRRNNSEAQIQQQRDLVPPAQAQIGPAVDLFVRERPLLAGMSLWVICKWLLGSPTRNTVSLHFPDAGTAYR